MWGNNANRLNNQNNSGVNVNTKLKNFNSDVSSLSTSFWNQNFSLTISPAIGPDGNGIMQYDQNRQGKTALTLEACEALVSQFKEVILPVYEGVTLRGETCPDSIGVTIETGKDPKRNIIGIEMTAPSDDSETPDLYFVLYGLVDENNISSPANTFKHKFAKRLIHIDYDPNTGISKKNVHTNADFNLFINMISKTELLLPFSEHVKKFMGERSKGYSGNNGNGSFSNGGYSNNSSYGGGNNSMNFASSPSYGGGAYAMLGSENGSSELPFN